MFGTKLDNELTMLQRVVALIRDLIIGVTVALTCLIFYFGGDTSKLNILDWTKLVGAATLIVIGPIVGYVIIRGLLAFLLRVSRFFGVAFDYYYRQGPMPEGRYRWIGTSLLKWSNERYTKFWRREKRLSRLRANRHPQLHKFFLKIAAVNRWLEPVVLKWYPYLFAFLTLLITILLFIRVIRPYIPKPVSS